MSQLEKAKLIHLNDQGQPSGQAGYNIEFLYNPTEITLSRSMAIEQAAGSRNPQGANKTSFKHPNPYGLKISNIILDTYEDGTSVLVLVEKFKKGVEFVSQENSQNRAAGSGSSRRRQRRQTSSGSGSDQAGQNKRPPIYLFTWGQQQYLRCFMKSVNFKFTMFLPDGTPVRAIVDLTLEQVGLPGNQQGQGTSQPSQSEREAGGRPIAFY